MKGNPVESWQHPKPACCACPGASHIKRPSPPPQRPAACAPKASTPHNTAPCPRPPAHVPKRERATAAEPQQQLAGGAVWVWEGQQLRDVLKIGSPAGVCVCGVVVGGGGGGT